MLYVLMGEDDYSLKQSLEEIKRGLGDPAALATNTVVLEGERVTIDHLRGACETVPFLAEKRLVVVEGLLDRFEPRSRPGQKKGPPDSRKEEAAKFAAYAAGIPDFTALVLTGGRIGSRNPLLTALAGKAEVRSFPPMRETRLKEWAEERARGVGAIISPAAVDLLVRFVGGNLWVMTNEIEKLALFAGGRRIEEKDVRAIVSYSQEANIFAMVDAMLESRPDAAGQLLRKLLQSGAAPSYLLVMLARQTQLIVRMKELVSLGKPHVEVQQTLGLADFAMRRTANQARRHSMERLREVYHRLLEADLSIKTGRYDGDLALDLLVAELCG